ncbi:ribosomal RNA small subunit methyltransferase A, partial [Chloroflexota bacterium]
ITAKPGRMSLLSISVQLYGEPTIISHVPARSFYPTPGVDSAIMRIVLYPQPAVEIADGESFFALVRAGCSASRKQMANSLAQGLGLSKAEVLALLEKAAIAPQRRAETLTLEEWAHLWQIFARAGESTC